MMLGSGEVAQLDVPADRDEGVDDARIVHRAAPRAQDVDGRFVGQRRAVRPIRRERIVAVDDRQYPRADRDVLARNASRVISSPGFSSRNAKI